MLLFFFFSSRRRHTRFDCDWSSDVCSSDLCSPTASATQTPAPTTTLGSTRPRQRTTPSKNSTDRKSTRLNSSHSQISYAVFCLKKKNKNQTTLIDHSTTTKMHVYLH